MSHSSICPAPSSEADLERALSAPTPRVISTLGELQGDLLILGAGGKLGFSLAHLARRGLDVGGKAHTRVVAVSRFGHASATRPFEEVGIETLSVDLLADLALERLPDVENVVYLVGMKFGSSQDMATTWALNTFLPGLVARRFRGSRIVALSTGNVYPLVDVRSSGAVETDPPGPVGEYALSCLGRERLFSYYSQTLGTPLTLVRLNYAVDLRYGVLVDICQRVMQREPIDVTMGSVNVIWQGDANAAILQSLGICHSPPAVVNVTGPETLSVRWLARRFSKLLDAPEPLFAGTEAETALLSNTALQQQLFGYPTVPTGLLINWVAEWLRQGGRVLNKPTGFQQRSGEF